MEVHSDRTGYINQSEQWESIGKGVDMMESQAAVQIKGEKCPLKLLFVNFQILLMKQYICVCFVYISLARVSEKCFSLSLAGCENNKS